jgi:GT2 family glycosyltransferase/glycosyltransferase involved in cell wall biosynthesis
MTAAHHLDLIVPIYRNKELSAACLDSLLQNMGEIAPYRPRLLLVNDSPDDAEVTDYLRSFARAHPNAVLLENEKNVGFVKSVNRALEMTRSERRSAVLINSDTVTFAGTLAGLLAAAELDPQIGFACPRSNNAAISTFPPLPHNLAGIAVTPQQTHDQWHALKHLLPQVSYAPTAVGFYLFVRREIIMNFTPLNEEFELGYEEENDLVMRANKVGYRAVLANHSFAFHAGSASFLLHDADVSTRKSANLQRLTAIHPEFLPLVRQFESSPEARAERLIKNLLPSRSGRLRMLIDLNRLGPFTNGTAELSVNVIDRLATDHSDRYEFSLLCSKASFDYHGFGRHPNLRRVDTISPDYAVAVNLGQPFDLHQINVLETSAPINVYGMLDTIAQDCGHLAVHSDILRFWKYVADHANGVFCISDFGRQSFLNRYARSSPRHYTQLLPTRLAEYASQYASLPAGERHILVMGNHFAHKGSDAIGELLASRFTNTAVAVLGSGVATAPNMTALRSGHVDDAPMRELFTGASVVVLPSYCEGFGFSLLHALALGKPVVARDIPATREILARFRSCSGVFLFEANEEIPAMVIDALQAGRSQVDDADCADWSAWVDGFVAFLRDLSEAPDLHARCVERLYAGDGLREARELRNLLPGPTPGLAQAAPPAPALGTPLASAQEVAAAPARPLNAAELLELDEPRFLHEAYLAILHRPPDPVGLAHYREQLRAGADKEEVLVDLARSGEGRRAGAQPRGLEALLKRSFGRRLKKRLFGAK